MQKLATPSLLAVLLSLACGANVEPKADGSPALATKTQAQPAAGARLELPPAGQLYHGVFPAGYANPEPDSDISRDNLAGYEQATGRSVAWVYLDNNWFQQRAFPKESAAFIRDHGSVPFIRLMLRSNMDQNKPEPTYTLDRIAAGDFDADLRAWGDAAREFGTPLVVEWGTEANGDWFSWTASLNGGGLERGAQKFRDVFRHIVQIIRSRGTSNIRWAFHANAETFPKDPRSSLQALYPGDDVVDWVGLSVYGAHTPLVPRCASFADQLDPALDELEKVAPQKPKFVFEFGVVTNNPHCDGARWTADAVNDMLGGRWPALKGFAWWNERWRNDSNAAHDSDMALQEVPALAEAFRRAFNGPGAAALVDRPRFSGPAGAGRTEVAETARREDLPLQAR